MSIFTEYQRQMWEKLTFLSVCRYYIEKDKSGKYVIREVGKVKMFFYWFMWINSSIKMLYLMLTYHGWLVEVHFLDQMSMWDWYLNAIHMCQEANIWIRKYPHYEILHRQWALQEEIFKKLGSPKNVALQIRRTDRRNKYFYSFVVTVGTLALLFQFFSTPKYALNTYAIIPYENFPLTFLFSIHECLFMYHAYAHQASTMVLAEAKSVSYTFILNEMTKTVYSLIELGGEKEKQERIIPAENNQINMAGSQLSSEYLEGEKDIMSATNHWRIKNKYLDPKTKAVGTSYDIETLLQDYKKLTLTNKAYNDWVGKRMGGCEASNYAQFVSDVFMMIQLLKEPDTDFMGVFFYFMDAAFGMMMLFRMLILMSRLYPASEEFIHALKCYTQYQTPLRAYLLKTIPSLRIIAAKLTGYSVRPKTVPVGVNILMNWYICAAMWNRPTDPSRIT